MGNKRSVFESEMSSSFAKIKDKSSIQSIQAGYFTQKLSDLLKNYRIQAEPLGIGAFGKVYKAYRKKDPTQKVAIKTIKKKGLRESELEDIYTEIKILTELDQPNIVRYLETYDDDKFIYLVMDILEGGSLNKEFKALASQGKRMRQDYLAKKIKQILLALNHIHSRNMMHRDIKLDNIMFDLDKNVYLVDFGLAVQTKRKVTELAGTAYYMAPEVINGSYDQKCDVWSVGVCLYYLLMGSYPFNGKNLSDVYSAILNGYYIQAKQVSKECQDFIQQCLQKNVSKRLSAAQALQHPWIVQNTGEELCITCEPCITPDIVERLQNYSSESLLRRQVYKMIIQTVLTEDIDRLKKAFYDLNREASGSISKEEFDKAILNYKGEIEKEKIYKILEELDYENTGKINFTDFISATITHHEAKMTIQKVMQIFKQFDIDGDGSLNQKDIENAFNKFGRKITKEEMGLIMKKHDKHGDGKIDYNEFVFLTKDILMGYGQGWEFFNEQELKERVEQEWDAKIKATNGKIGKKEQQEIVESLNTYIKKKDEQAKSTQSFMLPQDQGNDDISKEQFIVNVLEIGKRASQIYTQSKRAELLRRQNSFRNEENIKTRANEILDEIDSSDKATYSKEQCRLFAKKMHEFLATAHDIDEEFEQHWNDMEKTNDGQVTREYIFQKCIEYSRQVSESTDLDSYGPDVYTDTKGIQKVKEQTEESKQELEEVKTTAQENKFAKGQESDDDSILGSDNDDQGSDRVNTSTDLNVAKD